MTDTLTPEAQVRLDEYLSDTHRRLQAAGHTGIDEILADLRIHIAEELAGVEPPATRAAVDRVLHALGTVVDDEEPRSGGRSEADRRDRRDRQVAAALFAMFVTAVLVIPYGPYLLIFSYLASRAAAASRPQLTAGWAAWLVMPPLWIASAALVAVAMIGPVIPAGAWALERAGAGQWTVPISAAVAIVMGMWWIVAGAVVYAMPRSVQWLLWPVPVGRRVGAVVMAVGLVSAGAGAVARIAAW